MEDKNDSSDNHRSSYSSSSYGRYPFFKEGDAIEIGNGLLRSEGTNGIIQMMRSAWHISGSSVSLSTARRGKSSAHCLKEACV